MRAISAGTINADSYFSEPLFLDEGFVLAAPEMAVSAEMLNTLNEWRFTDVMSDGTPSDSYSGSKRFSKKDDENFVPLADTKKIKEAEDFYASMTQFSTEIFVRAALKNNINYNEIAEKIKEACDNIKENRPILLQVQNELKADEKSYLASHSVKSTVFSIIIGQNLKFPQHRLIELGIAALVHEIGMVQLPPRVYMGSGALTDQERQAITMHPEIGYNILKTSNFPIAASVPALEHHERENGAGYPRKLTGDKIDYHSKIVGVACSFEAITTKRPHKDARDGYAGMMDLLRNEGKQYDDTVIRALVFSLSIFPIGIHVLLSNNKKGQVVDVNPEDPRCPIVQVFGEMTPDGKNKVIKTSMGGIRVTRSLTKDEVPSGEPA
jgi:HD-GYP domain-containing protein (c-di-GMP phosphodiesterase class II)